MEMCFLWKMVAVRGDKKGLFWKYGDFMVS